MPDGAGEAFLSGNPAGFIAGKIGEGINATQALNQFRAAGGSFTTQSWYRVFGEVTASLANQETAAGINPYATPDAADYTDWSVGQGGRYATDINIVTRDRDTGMIGTTRYTYFSDDQHAPVEAAAAAWDAWSDPDAADAYDRTAVGWTVANVYQTVPWVGRG